MTQKATLTYFQISLLISVLLMIIKKKDFIHYFTKSASQLEKDIKLLKHEIEQNGIIWISWPNKAANLETDLNGNIVREIGLRNGLVDIKVCAVDEIWSGLKFVIPVKDRN